MSNRAQRRAAAKKKPGWQKLTHEQRLAALVKNGITPKDLEKAHDDAYNAGVRVGIDNTYKICFAAACLALNDLHRFGSKRCCDVLNQMQKYIIDTLTSPDAVNAVYKRMHLTMDFGDPCDWFSVEDD